MSSAPLHELVIHDGPKRADGYVVLLKDHVEKTSFLRHAVATYPDLVVTDDYDPGFLNLFAATSKDGGLAFLRSHADVLAIEEDTEYEISETVTQVDAPWGLARICTDNRLSGSADSLNWRYTYDNVKIPVSYKGGVNLIVDLMHYVLEKDFGGRAKWGKRFIGDKDADGHGHGTHVAGTVAGNRWGVAKTASLIAVKVLNDDGKGNKSTSIKGLEYVAAEAAKNKDRAAVVNMSLGGAVSDIQDAAITKLVEKGVVVVVSAGNNNVDAKDQSPARCEAAITVGSVNIQDTRAPSSNFGSAVNIFAPGVRVTSAGIESDTATARKSGTSMACPHVTGLVAYLIARQGKPIQPIEIKQIIQQYGIKDKLSDIPAGTVNVLARNDQ